MDYKNLKNVTFGMELEFSDCDRNTQLPEGLTWDNREQDIINSDCRAINPTSKTYTIGGEINTVPGSIEDQVRLFKTAIRILPSATVTFRSHLHLHIRFDGIREDVNLQKRVLTYIQNNITTVMNHNFTPTKVRGMTTSGWRYVRADRTRMQDWKYDLCMKANSPKEFYDAHQMVKDGTILPQTTKRYCLNLFSLKKHGTIEYRGLYMTMNPESVYDSLVFFADFMSEAVGDQRPICDAVDLGSYLFPLEIPYHHEQQLGWEKTNTKSGSDA